MWYCRMKMPKADRYKTVSLKTTDISAARERAFDQDADVRFRIKHDVPVFNRPFREVAREYLLTQEARAKRGEISAARPKKLRAVIEGTLDRYAGSTQVHLIGDERWGSYPAWRRENGAGRHIQLHLRWDNPRLDRFNKLLPRWASPSFRVPRNLEANHFLLMGDTGSGKSSAIRQILRQIAERGETAIVYDPALEFTPEFYSPTRGDLILNPLDTRCPYWSLGDEITRDETAMTIAAAFLSEKEYEKEFFTDGPRRILAHLLKWKSQPRDILRMMSNPSNIESAIKGTPLAPLLDPAAPAQRAGVLSSLNMVADSFELLPEGQTSEPPHRRLSGSIKAVGRVDTSLGRIGVPAGRCCPLGCRSRWGRNLRAESPEYRWP